MENQNHAFYLLVRMSTVQLYNVHEMVLLTRTSNVF